MNKLLRHTLAIFASLAVFAAKAEMVEFQGVTLEYTGAERLWPSGTEGEGDIVFVYDNAVGSLILPGSAVGRILAVGGGGAGSATMSDETKAKNVGGGGGDAGQLLLSDGTISLNNGVYTITVGAGGEGTKGGDTTIALDGKILDDWTASGGAMGDTFGNGGNNYTGKGGGEPKTQDVLVFGGAGGSGKECDITGKALYYAAGGGGAVLVGNNRGLGGSGVGGSGAFGAGGQIPATDGVRGSGGGGGSERAPAGKGGDGVVIIRISAVSAEPLVRPSEAQPADGYYYNGEKQNAISPSAGYEISGDRNIIVAGTYTTTAKLNPGFKWTDGTDEDDTVEWEIKKATNRIDNLALKGWKIGEKANSPTCTSLWGNTVNYFYAASQNAEEWIPFTLPTLVPKTAGLWYIKATVEESDNWEGAEKITSFYLWDDESADNFADNVEMTLPEGVGELFKFTLVEEKPIGFNHARAEGGFFILDKNGQMLDYEIESWNVEGVSTIKILAPNAQAGDKIVLYWRSDDEKAPPQTKLDEVTDETKVEFSSLVTRNRLKVNYFVEYPTIAPVRWELASPPGSLDISDGKLADNAAVAHYFYYATNPDEHFADYREMTRAGTYIAAFVPEAQDEYEPFAYELEINVIGHTAYTSLGSSAEGRVLLMNNDCRSGSRSVPAINYQGWYDAYNAGAMKQTPSYWVHEGMDEIALYNLRPGTSSKYYAYLAEDESTTELWRLKDCRHGNTFPRNDDNAPLAVDQNYLPYDAENSLRIGEHSAMKVRRRDVGQIVMRNVLDAAVVSPCYTNGVGTIYFDAVNGWTSPDYRGTNSYQIVVEAVFGEAAAYAADESDYWKPVKMRPMRIVDGAVEEELPETEVLELDVTKGESMDNFYRVYAPVDADGLARFRIRRVSIDPERSASPDGKALILIDNVIASYPAMKVDLAPAGRYDSTRRGKEIMGFEGACIPTYPSIDDTVYAQARATYRTAGDPSSSVKPNSFISSARMHYRWRYLNQATNDWQTVFLDPDREFKSAQPLTLPAEVGDVEFYYETDIQAPYYSYVDYSGGKIGVPGYSEEISVVTNHAGVAENVYPTMGTDWFVRLREGKSNYGLVRVFTRAGKDAPVVETPLAVVGEHQWRGYVRTPEAIEDGLEFRLEGIALGEDPETCVTNYWKSEFDLPSLANIKSAQLVKGDADQWSKVECTAATGHLMFMIDDSSRSLTVTRADYQNFNGWNDANKMEEIFVGSSEAEGRISGVAGRMKSFTERFENWKRSDPTSPYWKEVFNAVISPDTGYVGYVPFISGKTPNGWMAGHGMWVHERFQKSGMAFQMEGQGQGYLEFQNAAEAPRGLEKVTFSGRIAQTTQFGDIAYSFADGHADLENYTFVVQAVMSDQQPNNDNRIEDFTGNGQISVVANYRPMVGCYEFRVTRIDERQMAYELLKWKVSGGTLKATTLTSGQHNIAAFTNWANTPFVRGSDGNRPVMYISVDRSSGGVKVQAGYCRARSSFNAMPAAGDNFMSVCYWDSDTSLNKGSFGVASANCPATFRAPRYYDEPATWLGSVKRGTAEYFDTKPVAFNGAVKSEQDKLAKYWALEDGRYRYTEAEGAWGVLADSLAQTVDVQWAKRGTSDWTTVASAKIDGYMISDPITLPLYIREDAALRIVHGGELDDARVDVVIDDISFTQWRGDDYTNSVTQPFFTELNYGSPTNFVFTSAWVDCEIYDEGEEGPHRVELSPMRTIEGAPASIRSPLMDGYEGSSTEMARGIGLGMFTFAYQNADPSARLLLQIATNKVDITSLRDLTAADADDSRWTTVTSFDFSTLPVNGICSYYIGLHDVVGTMRIVVDPEIVKAAGVQKNPNYGRVVVTQAFCRDEPSLDTSCWWGWNLRTSADLHTAGDAKLMYLSDNVADGGPLEDFGLSVALNNSVYSDTVYEEQAAYKEHQPFVQTPTFKDAEVGEVIFKARRYDVNKGETARITVYGAKSGDLTDDSQWKYVTHFDITDNLHHTYTYRTEPGDEYKVFRFAVVGVKDAQEMGKADDPRPDVPVRVAFDEVVVCEAVRPMLAFRNVFAFRSNLKGRAFNPGYQDKTEQPLANEDFGVQAEVYASQLPDDIDFKKGIKVTLHWYNGLMTWGYDNWQNDKKTGHLQLVECEDAPLVFRGSYDNSSCIGAIKEPGSVVQYMLEVEYYTTESDKPVKTLMRKNDWEKPRWYVGIDYNDVEYKAYKSFAAYTILDSVSPGWAWINEVNVFGGYVDEIHWKNRDEDHQFVEVAIPYEASIPGWHLDFISMEGMTNTACLFMDTANLTRELAPGEAAASKKTHEDSKCVFLSVASPGSSDNIVNAGGDVDGTWKLTVADWDWTFAADGHIASDLYPVAIRLVRDSGVIEQEIVLEGTNIYNEISSEKGYEYSAKKLALDLNAGEAGGTWFDIGADMLDGDHSLSVLTSHGEGVENWSNTPKRTPGRKNEGQTIDPDHPTPSGSTVFVYCHVDSEPGHLTQTVGEAVNTTETVLVIVPKESPDGTNIVYNIENWYELGEVTTNEVPIALSETRGKVTVNVARNATGTIEVRAKSKPDSRLDEYVKADDPYRMAIVDWLNKGTNAYGDKFESDENPQKIHLADLMKMNGEIKRQLSLTEMYWYDINPFQAGWAVKTGFSEAPYPVIVDENAKEGDIKENRRIGIYMCITNQVSGARRAPDVLRSLDPGKTSWDYISGEVSSWTSVTFKVTGYIVNGLPYNIGWVPLRWFVFGKDSFNPAGSEKEFQTSIEIIDPYSRYSPTWKDGWGEWWGDRASAPVWNSFNVNTNITNIGVETLSPTNWYDFAEKEEK